MSTPLKIILPAEGSISLRIDLPTVVLPHPDSPTKPNVSPLNILKDKSSTALTFPTVLEKSPFLIGKIFLKIFYFN